MWISLWEDVLCQGVTLSQEGHGNVIDGLLTNGAGCPFYLPHCYIPQ